MLDNNKDIKKDIEGLDRSSRKDLFNKFVEHGGEVVKKKAPASSPKFNRDKQREYLKAQEKQKKELSRKYPAKKSSTSSSSSKNSQVQKQSSLQQYEGVGKIGLYFNSVFARVRTITGGLLTETFAKMYRDTAQSKMLDLNLVITTIVHSKSMTQEGLKKDLILKYPLFYELLLRLDKLFDDKMFIDFSNKYSASGGNVRFVDIKDMIIALFKKLYILQPNRSACIDAIGTSLGLMNKYENISRGAINETLSKARASINYLLGTFFDKLFLALLNSIGSNLPLNSPYIHKLLEMQEEDYVGYIVKKIKEEIRKKQLEKENETLEEQKEEVKEEEEDADMPPELTDGFSLIKSIDFSKDKFTKDQPEYYFQPNDKIYRIFRILDEFEKQYSFVLTSNKIKYVVDYHNGGRLDPKSEFNEIYLQLNNVHDGIREYMNIIREAWEIENKPGVPVMQKHNQLHNLSIRQSKTNMSIRIKLLDILKKLVSTVGQVHEKSDLVVQNSDDKLSFDNSLEGKKKLEGKTPIESLKMTLEFFKAFAFLVDKGELGGAGIYIS
jgi:hypothetical protein